MGSLDLIPNALSNFHDEVIKFQKNQTKFTVIMIILAIMTTTAAISTMYLSYQTGKELEHLREINEAKFDIDNPLPLALPKYSFIYLDRMQTQTPIHSFEGIEIDPISNHPLKISVIKVSMLEPNSKWLCMFKEIPNVRLFEEYSVYWKVGEEVKKLEPTLSIDYKIRDEYILNKNSDEKPILAIIGQVFFELQIEDLQNNRITQDVAFASLFLWIDHTEPGLTC